MKCRGISIGSIVLNLAVLIAYQSEVRAQDPPPPAPDGTEVLARGPVHEAFAQPSTTQPEPGQLAPKAPPEPVDELPPDQKPEGDDVQWIPGYWSWDEEATEYIWVSGFWRAPPPGRRWLAGHWQAVANGWQWVAGFWAPTDIQDIQYLPEPPPTLDQGPAIPAPDDNSTYIPGVWTYQQTGYRWRPGYWYARQPNWVWIPAHYVWTPGGYLFINGYWDHPLDQRGLLFAPIRFGATWGGGRFTPQFVVNADFLMGALFVRPAYHHYYFGDYFENRYATRGFVAWPNYRIGKTGYDSNYNYYRHQHASEPKWDAGVRELYRARASGEVARPPITLGNQIQAIKTLNTNKSGNVVVHKNVNITNVQNVTALTPLKEVHNTRVTNLGSLSGVKESKIVPRPVKVIAVPQVNHVREVKAAEQLRAAAVQRQAAEAKILHERAAPVAHTDPPRAVKLELPKPIPHITPQPAPIKVAPPHPVIPAHIEQPIPKFTPRTPPAPPPAPKTPPPPPKKK